MGQLFAGWDVSTQSTKLLVIDAESQTIVFNEAVNYDQDLPHYKTKDGAIQGLGEGASESDPNMWVEAVNILLQKLADSKVNQHDLVAMSVSGQQHGLVALDHQGNLSRKRSKLWNDFSTQEECDLLTEKVGGLEVMVKEVSNSQRTGYTAAKIFHLYRHEREIYDNTATFFLVHNYINYYLTGGPDGGVKVMEPGDTSGTALYNIVSGQWSDVVINAIDPGLKTKLAPVQPSTRSIGRISKQLVEQYGLNPACRIDAGTGDNMYGAVGTGNVKEGIVTISLGTSGTAYTFLKKPYVDPTGEIAGFCDSTGHYLPLLCVSNLANGYNEILKLYNLSHQDFTEIIRKSPVGNNGRMIAPWYVGERTPDVPNGTPVYFGFALNDLNQKEVVCRGVLEGHLFNLYDGFKRMPVNPSEIRLTGGISRSVAWREAIANIFNAETVFVEGEGAAMGAALHALWVYQMEQGKTVTLEEVVAPYIKLDETTRIKPTPKDVATYRTLSTAFSALSARLRNVPTKEDPFRLRKELVAG
jgi:xylulokinase